MNNNKVNKILSVLLICFGSILSAQDIEADLNSMCSYYEKPTALKIEMSITTSGAMEDIQKKVQVWKKGDAYVYQMEGVRVYNNPSVSLWINSVDKMMVLTRRKKKDANHFKQMMHSPTQIDSLLKLANHVQYMGEEKGNRVYSMQYKNSVVSEVEYHYSPELHFPARLTYFYHPDYQYITEQVDVLFDVKENPSEIEEIINLNKYLITKGQKIAPGGEYSGYEIEIIEK